MPFVSEIRQAFEQIVSHNRDRIAWISRAEALRLSFVDLMHRIQQWEEAAGDRLEGPVALATGNCSAFFELFLACRGLGVPVVAMDGSLPLSEQLVLASSLGCKTLVVRQPSIASEETTQQPKNIPDETVYFFPVETTQAAAIDPGTVLIKLTSGSTGNASGICHSEASLLSGIHQIGAGMGISQSDRVLIAIPLSHSYGFDNGVLSLAVLGTPLVLESPTYIAQLTQTLVDEKVTFFPTVPPLVHFLSEGQWPKNHHLRSVICAGGRLDPEVASRFRSKTGCSIHQFYGSTETGGICFESEPNDPLARGTVGIPLPGVTIHLDSKGRVGVESNANYVEVLGDPPELAGHTVLVGDLAEWTPEGRLRITGRADEFVNVNGRRVSIPAIEQSLRQLEGVDEAAAVGVDDAIRGERLIAFVVGSLPEPTHLPQGLHLRDLRKVGKLPYTRRGKIDRKQLLELIVRETSEPKRS